MKTIRDLYNDIKLEETVTNYGHKVRVQGRWARLQARKQVNKVEDILEIPQNQFKKLTTDLQHDVAALKRLYENQKKEITKLAKTFRKNKDRFVERSKVFSSFNLHGNLEPRKEKVVRDSDVA